jgi:hypothetical protein
MALSLSWVAYAATVSHQLCHFKQDDWWGGPFIWITLCCVPQAVWDASLLDKGPPQPRPDGAGQFCGVLDEDVQDEDDDEDNKTSSDSSAEFGCRPK